MRRLSPAIRRPLALALAALQVAFPLAPTLQAAPVGGTVVRGIAGIDTSVSNLTRVTQVSDRAIVNWQSFSTSAGETVQFAQPSASAAILNRVTGADPSVLAGTLNANGRVFLLNSNGSKNITYAQVVTRF